ncbi:MAG: NmrA family NAD(P)-binding protein [Chloroflexi bacterium]|nr:NmrA family NAD(P)-binding protein [Chloroflexota bacterium]
MILVTGAAGKTGQAIIRGLHATGARVRALIRRPEQEGIVLAAGAHEALAGDMTLESTFDRALSGIRTIYHICPNMCAYEVEMGKLAIQWAKRHTVEHFVFHSVLHPQVRAMPHHWDKLLVEDMLFEAGLPYTILQPVAYMQNIMGSWNGIINEGKYHVPYPIDTRLGMVDLLDVAQAAAVVMTTPGHHGATYELCGNEILTPKQMASIMSDILEQEVAAVEERIVNWQQNARHTGMDEEVIKKLTAMFQYYATYGFWGNSNALRHLIGRDPATFADCVLRTKRVSA